MLIMYDLDDWTPEGVKSASETSDPTASRAIHNVDERYELMRDLKREQFELQDLIATSGEIIDKVKGHFVEKYGVVLELRYIDCHTWTDIADAFDASERTMRDWAQRACDWVDSIGVSRLLGGQYEI